MISDQLFGALGSIVGGRFHPDELPQGIVWPAMRYSFPSITPDNTICGASLNGDEYRVQLDIFAISYGEVRALRDAVVTAMEAFVYSNDRQVEISGYDADSKIYHWMLQYLSNEQ